MLANQLKILLQISIYTLLGGAWIYGYHELHVYWWLLFVFLSMPLFELIHIMIWQVGETVPFVLLEYFVIMAAIVRELLLLIYNLTVLLVKIAALLLIFVCLILLAGITLWVVQQFGVELYQTIYLDDLKLFLKWFTIFASLELVLYLVIMATTRVDSYVIGLLNKVKLG